VTVISGFLGAQLQQPLPQGDSAHKLSCTQQRHARDIHNVLVLHTYLSYGKLMLLHCKLFSQRERGSVWCCCSLSVQRLTVKSHH
jgi:hypothetical protein